MSTFNLSAQNTDSVRKAIISDVYVNPGFMVLNYAPFQLNDFILLSSDIDIQSKDYAEYSYGYFGEFLNTGFISIKTGLNFYSKSKQRMLRNPQLRFGFTYIGNSTMNCELVHTLKKPYDTLQSAQTGNVVYVDSVIRRNLNMSYHFNQLRIDVSCLFRTPDKHRCTLYSGIGLQGGMMLSAYTNIRHDETKSIEPDFLYSSSLNNKLLFEKNYRNKMGYSFAAYIPAGVDLRLGKTSEFWKRVHLFADFTALINITFIPELQSYTNFGFMTSMGLRISTLK